MIVLWQSFKEIKKHNVNILSYFSSAGEFSINNDISVLFLVTITPNVILPILIPWLGVKREGKNYPSIYDNKKKRVTIL